LKPVCFVPKVEHLQNALVDGVQVFLGEEPRPGHRLFPLFVGDRQPRALHRAQPRLRVLLPLIFMQDVLHHGHLHLLDELLLHLHQQRLQHLFEVPLQSTYNTAENYFQNVADTINDNDE